MQPLPATSLVSVLMPAYNHAAYIGAAVESVLKQSYGNVELIVIDDASADDTWAVLQTFQDARLRRLRHEVNRGSHATLNEALQWAQGEFLAIINSDDVFHPDRIAACVEALQTTQAGLVGTDIALIDDAGQRVTDHWWVAAFNDLKHVQAETGDWVATLMEGNVFMTTSNFCFRRSWLEAVGDFSDLRYVLDYEWLLRGLANGEQLAWVDELLLSYRLHAHNTIAERPLAANLECAALLRQFFPQLLGNDASGRTRLRHLASQWKRIEKYLGEIEASRRHQALVAMETELFRLIHDRDRWIAERDDWITERDRRIADCDRWIAERDRWIAERDAALAACHDAIAAIVSSRSFRLGHALTAPARWLRDRIARRSGKA